MDQKVKTNMRRIVIKIGSSLITNEGRGLNSEGILDWTQQISKLHARGCEVVLVSSGAVAEGMVRLGIGTRPRLIHDLQAAAAVGQMGLIRAYEDAFRAHRLLTAQILLTHDDLSDRTRYLNARSTLQTLIKLSVIPIVNENDSIATDEIRFGDNDTLAALVANLIEADTLIILTDQDGLYTEDPRVNPEAQIIEVARSGDPSLEAMASGNGSHVGSGGMITKLRAAKRAARSGTTTIIANGFAQAALTKLYAGNAIGTRLTAPKTVIAARKQWLSNHLKVRGSITLDAGAITAITTNRKSLLPIGVLGVEGAFQRGDVIACKSETGNTVALGLTNYNSTETDKIKGRPSELIEKLLGYATDRELINRDNLALQN
jgi:glutamate 5-kinase